MENLENQNEEIQITAANSGESLNLSNITSDAEKLDELMNVIFKEDNEESLDISAFKQDQFSRQSTIKSSDSENSSIESNSQIISQDNENYNQYDQQQIEQPSDKIKNYQLYDLQKKRLQDESQIRQMSFSEIEEMDEEQSPIEKTSKEFDLIKEMIRNQLRNERNSNNDLVQNYTECSEDFHQEETFNQQSQNNDIQTKTNKQGNQTLISLGSGDQLISPNSPLQLRQQVLQMQLEEQQNQQEFFCGCIIKNQDNAKEEDYCNVL